MYYRKINIKHMQLTTIVPTPVSISTPKAFNELVKLLRILEARLFA